jgi:hypothetical protein
MKYRFLLLIILSVVIGCGKKAVKSKDVSEVINAQLTPFKEFEKTTVLDERAPRGLGLILVKQGIFAKSCQGMVINESYFLTNSDCMPRDWIERDCVGQVSILIRTGDSHEPYYCERIIMRSEESKISFDSPNFALIKLNQPVLDSELNFSRKGILNDQELQVFYFKGDTTNLGKFVEYEKSVCSTTFNSVFGNYTSPLSSTAALFKSKNRLGDECEFKTEYSGAPILNQKNEVVGLLQAGKAPKDLDIPRGLISYKDSKNLNIATNIACLDLPFFEQETIEGCLSINEELTSRQRRLKIIADKIKEAYEAEVLKLKSNLLIVMQYEVLLDAQKFSSQALLEFRPTCMKPIELWTEEEKKLPERVSIFRNKRYLDAGVPKFIIKLNLIIDQYGAVQVIVNSKEIEGKNYLIPIPSTMNEQMILQSLVLNDLFPEKDALPYDISICP